MDDHGEIPAPTTIGQIHILTYTFNHRADILRCTYNEVENQGFTVLD